MHTFDSPLNNLKIASPCSADWNAMYGNERKRFCGDCKLNVYNLSGMTSYDAENLLRNSEGRLCVRYFKRSDGSVITADCPVGWAKVRQRLSVCTTAVFSLIISIMSGFFFVSLFSKQTSIGKRIDIPFVTPTPQPLMGAIAMPTPKQKPSPKSSHEKETVEVMGNVG
ncbi:MAG: hypothetical protein H7070_13830 [Saprospiraceae bacterium]|nr:hypothetical protein [Pyrinomonadaceae bacterium]